MWPEPTPIIGQSRLIAEVHQLIDLVAPRRSTVLVTGESGTGKELVARAIHDKSGRSGFPLVAVNCGALPESLLETELFGHTRGAFTGAVQPRTGHFEAAHRGTVFLDEVAEIPITLQTRLLRVLQEGEFQRVGSSQTTRVDVRVIAATNADLAARVRARTFREDLFYRLNVVEIHLPSLRDRVPDIPLLARYFLEQICGREGLPPKELSRDALYALVDHPWPGNVRELENTIEKAAVLSGSRLLIEPGDLRLAAVDGALPRAAHLNPFVAVPDEGLDFEKTVSCLERALLEQALLKTNGNKKRAAEILRLKRTTLAAKLRTVTAA